MIKSVAIFLLGLVCSTAIFAQGGVRNYEVTITNLTKGQSFTPVLAATHTDAVHLFTLGDTASGELATLAEAGNTEPLQTLLLDMPESVFSATAAGGLLEPGDTRTFEISGSVHYNRLSIAAMLIPTNDTFVALNSMELPKTSATAYLPGYDAGSELNDELCANIPGPVCMDPDDSGAAGEGYVYIGNGIRGIGDLSAAEYDWNNPVAYIEVRRIR